MNSVQPTRLSDALGIFPMAELPIDEKKQELLQLIKDNQVVVLKGETACGKSTRTPLYLLEAGLGYFGKIAVTEPRRIAARSLAPYVASFVDSKKRIIGGRTRFWNTTTEDTQVVYMTTGELIQDMLFDPLLSEYSAIIIDEAHERDQNIDYLLGFLKTVRKSRPELKIVIASATIDVIKFSEFFNGAPIIEIPGRTYPVEVIYSTVPHFAREVYNPRGAALEVANKIVEIHQDGKDGDILAFLAGRNEIADCTEFLKPYAYEDWVILPAYGHMDLNEQAAIFDEFSGKRKIILATNVAETSITPVGVKFIVDPGLIKQMDFYPGSSRSSLQTRPHSRSGVDQRAGRAGRTQDGICYRLYTEEEYNALPLFTSPEICRTNLESIVLNMRYIGIQDVEHFPFIDKPNHSLFKAAFETLKKMGAMDSNEVLTDYGRKMATLPLEPVLGHMLLQSVEHGCVNEIATIVASISAGHVFLRPPEEEEQVKADAAHERFLNNESDALTFLNVWEEYKQHEGDMDWCLENYLNEKALMEVDDIRMQLQEIFHDFGIEWTSTVKLENVLKTFAIALIDNLFKVKEEKRADTGRGHKGDDRRKGGSNIYYAVVPKRDNAPAFIHPSSATFGKKPEMLVCLEVVRTTKEYMRTCSVVKEEWVKGILPAVAPEGKKLVIGYRNGSNVALVRGIDKGSDVEKVSVKEARKYYSESVSRAKNEGCAIVTIVEKNIRRRRIYSISVKGIEYIISNNSLIDEFTDGSKYYAKLRVEKSSEGDRYFADVKFGLFDLGKEEIPKKGKHYRPEKGRKNFKGGRGLDL